MHFGHIELSKNENDSLPLSPAGCCIADCWRQTDVSKTDPGCRAILWLLLGELFFEFAGELVDVGGLAKSLNLLGCRFDIDACVLTELLQHLEHHGEFLLGEHTDLKIEVRAPLCLASHAILTDEHEDGQENALGGDKKRQNAEGERIESFHAGNQVEIHGAPDGNQNHVEHKEFYAADEFYDGIADVLGRCPAI